MSFSPNDTYKVWLHMERIPADGSEPVNMDGEFLPIELGIFENELYAQDAIDLARHVTQYLPGTVKEERVGDVHEINVPEPAYLMDSQTYTLAELVEVIDPHYLEQVKALQPGHAFPIGDSVVTKL